MNSETAIQSIKSTLRGLVIATVVLYAIIGATVIWTWNGSDNNRQALCALRLDLERRVESSKTFLRDHPEGIAGISAKTIQDGIDNQERTIAALGGLDCGS